MAKVKPLSGIRYASGEPLAKLVTPPYDVISPQAQARYYERNPHNIIRLELGRDEPGDDALDNKYTRAAMLFAQWRLDGILAQDVPSLYLYEQRFTVEGQSHAKTSLFARVRLEPWAARVVLPHERTMPKPKRTAARDARDGGECQPHHVALDDPHDELAKSFVPLRRREPDAAFTDEAGEDIAYGSCPIRCSPPPSPPSSTPARSTSPTATTAKRRPWPIATSSANCARDCRMMMRRTTS